MSMSIHVNFSSLVVSDEFNQLTCKLACADYITLKDGGRDRIMHG